MVRFHVVVAVLLTVLGVLSGTTGWAAEQEPDLASPTADSLADAPDEPLRWRCPAPDYSPDVLCTDTLYPPSGDYQEEAQAITTFPERPWFLRPFDWLRDLFTATSRENP